MSHEITLVQDHGPHDGNGWWRAECSCGKYLSGRHAHPGRAEAAGRDHAKAKGGEDR